jgi:hypothetical protein
MRVVIAHSIRKKECKRGKISSEDLRVILGGYAKGIFTQIKGASLPKGSRLIKLYVTTVGGAKRIVFLVDVETNVGYLLFYRGKNDSIGKNISIKNPAFKKKLLLYIDLLNADMETKGFAVYEVS